MIHLFDIFELLYLKEVIALDRFLLSLQEAGVEVKIIQRSENAKEANVLYCWFGMEMSTTDCFFQFNNHILPIQVKSCWKIYKGCKHRTQGIL